MGANSSSMVTVGKPQATGAISSAPLKTPLPNDATSNLNSAFVMLGYTGADGLKNAVETSTEDIKAWGGDVVVSSQTERKETFSFKLIQSLDPDVLKEVYGAENVTGSGALTVKHNGKPLPRRIYAFEMLMTGGRKKRIIVPNGQITEVGEVSYVDGEEVGYEVTLTAFPDSNGDTAIEYLSAAG